MNPKIIVVSGPVIVENNKVLLNQHGDSGLWKFCGGKVEDYSTDLIENAKREVREEMGIEVEILDEHPYITYRKKETEEGEIDVILVHYLAKRKGAIKPAKDIEQWQWLDINNLPEEAAPNIVPVLKYFGYLR